MITIKVDYHFDKILKKLDVHNLSSSIEELAKGVYFYCPMGVTVIINMFLFISTSIKISKHKKDTICHLRSSESRRHDDSKQW